MRIYDAHEEGGPMQTQSVPKKPTNLTLDQGLLSEARAFGVNLSQAAEAGLRRAVGDAKAATWQRENAAALDASNAWVDQHGLPLAKYRPF
jgi:antitoxin CcdA